MRQNHSIEPVKVLYNIYIYYFFYFIFFFGDVRARSCTFVYVRVRYRSLSVILSHKYAPVVTEANGNNRIIPCMALKYDRSVVIPFRKNNATHGKFAQNNSLSKLHRLLQSPNDTPYRCLATLVTPRQVGYDKCVLVPFRLHPLIVPHYIDPLRIGGCDAVLLHRLAHGAEGLDKL